MKRIILAVCVAFTLASSISAQEIAPFKKGDRVAFVGNSITDGGHYHSYIWLYYMTRFPNADMWMYNCGIGGDTGEDIYKRLETDVFAKKPTVMTLTFGMNDSGYFEYNGSEPQKFADQQVEKSLAAYQKTEKLLKEQKGIRIVMLGTSPYDETAKIESQVFPTKNTTIRRIIKFQKESAQKNHWEFYDFNEPMTQIDQDIQKQDPAFTLEGSDRIHPDNDGHMAMAYLFLRAQNYGGCPEVADFAINATENKVEKSVNCKISDLTVTPQKVRFNYLANSLPYPLDTIARGGWGFKRPQNRIKQIIPSFMTDMNKEIITVKGLKGNYELKIDDETIGTYSAEQLSTGVNLAECTNTPQYQQAQAVMALNEERWDVEHRFRDYAWLQHSFFAKHNLLFADNQEAIDAMIANSKDPFVNGRKEFYSKAIHKEVRDAWAKQLDLLVSTIYKVNKPQNHVITLTAIN